MPRLFLTRPLILCCLAAASAVQAQGPLGTAFTYQGQLKKTGIPLTATADFQFTLWDALAGGNQIGAMVPVNNVNIVGGLFTADLDFGADAFTGEARWVQIAVRSPGGGGQFVTLVPRQELTPAPHALVAAGLRLPYAGRAVSNNQPLFKITQAGTREAGVFEINNPQNAMTALTGFTNGTGLGLQAWTTGMGGTAMFDIPVAQNPSDVLSCLTVGLGRAGMFEINNPANVKEALYAKTNGGGYALWADNTGPNPGAAAIFANGQVGQGAEIVTQNGGVPALTATNRGNGIAVLSNGKVQTSGQIISTLAQGTAPLAVTSRTVNVNLNADMVDGMHQADMDNRYLNVGEANCVGTAMLQDDSVTVDKLAHNIDARPIGFNAASVGGATIVTGVFSEGTTTVFLQAHGGDVSVSPTGSWGNHKLRYKNNLNYEVRVTVLASTDATSSVTTVAGGATVDIAYPHYTPCQIIIGEAGMTSDWTVVMWLTENDGVGSYLAINHDN